VPLDEPALLDRVAALQRQSIDDLQALVRIPSVSADPARAGQVRASADWVAEQARRAGASSVDVLSADGGRPAVVASWPAPPGAPTVLLYAHHDVQPADPAGWASEPFEPVERDGRLYGRGAADDKAGVLAHLTALRAHDGRPPVGVTLFVEGEEEIGSPTFRAFLQTYGDRLRADVLVVADSQNWSADVPALTTTLRGLVDCVVEVRTLRRAVHSGMFGGAAPDALSALARVLASLHTDDGDVAVPGLVAGSTSGPDADPVAFRAEAGMLDEVHLVGTGSLNDRLWMRPAVSVLALDAPRVADASNILVPAATAVVSMRLAPGQDPTRAMDALRAHLQVHAPWGAKVSVQDGAGGAPTIVPATGPAVDTARAALRDAFGGAEPVEIGVGGSIPFIAELAEAYPDAAILVTGAGDPAANWHGPDESLHLGMFAKVCAFEALLLARLAPPT
jgi:acetylornithine deacetylase/succinyl-diaminopimelate desuccinylase-like protein